MVWFVLGEEAQSELERHLHIFHTNQSLLTYPTYVIVAQLRAGMELVFHALMSV